MKQKTFHAVLCVERIIYLMHSRLLSQDVKKFYTLHIPSKISTTILQISLNFIPFAYSKFFS